MNTVEKLAGLIRETSSSLPEDVESALAKAKRREQGGSSASVVLGTVLDNVRLARKLGSPLCQDTGTLAFYIDASLRRKVSPAVVKKAVALATTRGYLRKNCIDSVTGKSYDDNCADGAPVIHYVDWVEKGCVRLVLKGGGSENMSRQYSLPDSGGDRATAYEVAKEQLLRSLDASGESSDAVLRRLERSILRESNSLGIGPMGLGGKTTLLGVRIASRPRVPASFFVTVAYMCWACRRGSLKFKV